MKTQNTRFQFKKSTIVELNKDTLSTVVGGTVTIGGCFLCIRTSNGPGSIILEDLTQA
ncbi:hypothetical protein [Lacinutrix sp. Hel_I_90]|uniref:hypothetical protein n=1 Tax=Lacinutrix sp. Hel_I_90 TaxID=1249999 RepID=UPI000AE4FAA9|nr:hypothetical protein [Lacinutrix sp. Hel_I_90]